MLSNKIGEWPSITKHSLCNVSSSFSFSVLPLFPFFFIFFWCSLLFSMPNHGCVAFIYFRLYDVSVKDFSFGASSYFALFRRSFWKTWWIFFLSSLPILFPILLLWALLSLNQYEETQKSFWIVCYITRHKLFFL